METVEQLEQNFMNEIDDFESSYKHRVKCAEYDEVGFCRHVEKAERKRFGEKRTLLIQLRINSRR